MPPMHKSAMLRKSQPESHRGSASPPYTSHAHIIPEDRRAAFTGRASRRRGTGRKNISKKHRPPLGYHRICIAPDGPGAHQHSSPTFSIPQVSEFVKSADFVPYSALHFILCSSAASASSRVRKTVTPKTSSVVVNNCQMISFW